MFEFYIAAREQKETGHPGIFSRQKHSTIIYVICLLLICLWFAGMVLVGGYARQLWALWIVKAEARPHTSICKASVCKEMRPFSVP